MIGYTTPDRIQQHLGKTFTADQLAECQELIEAAEAWVEDRTGRSWLNSGAVTESFTVFSDTKRLKLSRRPVTSVESVTVRPYRVGADTTTLVANTDYELIDPANGIILLSGGWTYWSLYFPHTRKIDVAYTPDNTLTLDPRVTLLATQLVAFWLRPTIEGISTDIKSYSVGDDLRVTFQAGGRTLGIPDSIVTLADNLRGRLAFA